MDCGAIAACLREVLIDRLEKANMAMACARHHDRMLTGSEDMVEGRSDICQQLSQCSLAHLGQINGVSLFSSGSVSQDRSHDLAPAEVGCSAHMSAALRGP